MTDLGELNRCRLCSSQTALTDVFSAPNKDDLFQMIDECTSIRISFERDFPCAVCSCCIRIVNQFCTYRRKCLEYDRELKRLRGDVVQKTNVVPTGEVTGSVPKPDLNAKDGEFYENMKQQMQSYLAEQVKEIERKALQKVEEALKKRKEQEEIPLQMTVETEPSAEDIEFLNDTSSFHEQQHDDSGDEFKVEVDSVQYNSESDDIEEVISVTKPQKVTESAGNSTDAKRKGNSSPITKAKSPMKKQLRSSMPAEPSKKVDGDPNESLEEQLEQAKKKINKLMQHNYRLELKQLRLESGEPAVQPFQNYKLNLVASEEVARINTNCPVGPDGDGKFIGALADQMWTREQLAERSVRGKQCFLYPESSAHIRASPNKVSFIHDKLLQRINLEQLDDDDPRRKLASRVSRKLSEKMANTRRIKDKQQPKKR